VTPIAKHSIEYKKLEKLKLVSNTVALVNTKEKVSNILLDKERIKFSGNLCL
jgi:hypothetical protein